MNTRKTRAYISWKAMNTRCNNPDGPKYHRYGGRGISICPSWKSFDKFFEDMGEREVNQTIDRIDNDGNYCKANCKWSTVKEQNRNREASIKYLGENAIDASMRLGGNRNLVAERIKLEWKIKDAFTIPASNGGPSYFELVNKNKSDTRIITLADLI